MAAEGIVVHGLVLPDGTLQIQGPVSLPPGPVEVAVRPGAPSPPAGVMDVLARIDAARDSWPDYVPRTAEEIDASIQEMREEWAEQSRQIEDLQEDCRRAREASSGRTLS